MHVISTADRLCVPDLVDATQRDAAASLSTDIVVALSCFSWLGLPSLKILRQATTDYKCAHSEQLLARDDLRKTLLLPTPLSVVACPSLCVRDEALLLQAVLRRLSYSTHTKKDVVALLGSVRLYQLDEDSLDAPSFVARGGAAWPVVEHEDALQERVTDVVRGGLSCLGVGAVGQPSLGSSPQRCSVVGRSGTALSDPRGDQNSYVIPLTSESLGTSGSCSSFRCQGRWRRYAMTTATPLCVWTVRSRQSVHRGGGPPVRTGTACSPRDFRIGAATGGRWRQGTAARGALRTSAAAGICNHTNVWGMDRGERGQGGCMRKTKDEA